MPDKDKKYNDSPCNFCPGKVPCAEQREATVFDPTSLPRKCMYALYVLHNPPPDALSIEIDCPRCGRGQARMTSDFVWSPGKRLRTFRKIGCPHCGLDLQERVA